MCYKLEIKIIDFFFTPILIVLHKFIELLFHSVYIISSSLYFLTLKEKFQMSNDWGE